MIEATLTSNNESSVVYHRVDAYDFTKIKASIGRNCIHDYPAMLHTLLVRSLLDEFAHSSSVVYDPFCGSGTTMVEGLFKGLDCIGTDINPLALLIAKVRCSSIDFDEAKSLLKKIIEEQPTSPVDVPKITNMEFWFRDDVIRDLGQIRWIIRHIDDTDLRNFFLVCFSATVRKVSNTKQNEFKRVRVKKDDDIHDIVSVIDVFESISISYINIMHANILKGKNVRLYKHDSRDLLQCETGINLVVTSPPYGDSRTTVAYGQFSSFGLEWIRGLNPFGDEGLSLDNKLLGGKAQKHSISIKSITANRICNTIASIDQNRAGEVQSFIYDLQMCISNICSVLSDNGVVCFVVGNRIVKNVLIPLDVISKELFEFFGLEYVETRIRNISMKRMPNRNSPSNIVGMTSSTMMKELIVICRREES